MHDLTWGEFKALMEAAGVQETDRIEWVDVSHPSTYDNGSASIEVFHDAIRHSVAVY